LRTVPEKSYSTIFVTSLFTESFLDLNHMASQTQTANYGGTFHWHVHVSFAPKRADGQPNQELASRDLITQYPGTRFETTTRLFTQPIHQGLTNPGRCSFVSSTLTDTIRGQGIAVNPIRHSVRTSSRRGKNLTGKTPAAVG